MPKNRVDGLDDVEDKKKPCYPGLVCIQCNKCVALKLDNVDRYLSLDSLLRDETNPPSVDGWHPVRGCEDVLKQRILNHVVYKINEPPLKEEFECNYTDADMEVDTIYLLWSSGKAVGFITSRLSSVLRSTEVTDTIFISLAFRGRGYMRSYLKQRLDACELEDLQLAFSNPVSNKLLRVLLKFMKVNSGCRERIWIADEANKRRDVLWWSALKLTRDRGLSLRDFLA